MNRAMPLIHVDITAGKATEEAKAQLIARLTDVVTEVLGEAQRNLTIITIIETPPGNRGIGGRIYCPSPK